MHASPALRTSAAPLRCFSLCAALACAACAPEKIDINVHDIFTGDAARYALQNQMPAAQLASVGGYLPAASWPASAAPLLLDVRVIAENKIDLTGNNIDPSDYSGIRLHWATLEATALPAGALSPRPTAVEIYLGPAAATALTDTGVLPLASGAFPLALQAHPIDCDAGDCAADGADAGPSDAGSSDAGSADGGAGASDAGAPGQTLVFAADAQETLRKLVFAGAPFSLFVVLHLPVDSAADPLLPTGGDDLAFDVQFELAK